MELVATFSPELLAAPELLGGPRGAALRPDGRHGHDPPGFAALLAALTEGGMPPGEALPLTGNGLPLACDAAPAPADAQSGVLAASAATLSMASSIASVLGVPTATPTAAAPPLPPPFAAQELADSTHGSPASPAAASPSAALASAPAATLASLGAQTSALPSAVPAPVDAATLSVPTAEIDAAASAAQVVESAELDRAAPRPDFMSAFANAPRAAAAAALEAAQAAQAQASQAAQAAPALAPGNPQSGELTARRAPTAYAASAHDAELVADSAFAPIRPDGVTPPPRADGVAALGRWLAESRAPLRTEGAALAVPDAFTSASAAPSTSLPNAAAAAPQHHAVAAGNAQTAPLGHGTLDLSDAAWNEQLLGRIRWLVDRDAGEARIKLHPADLGALDVKISLRDEQTFVQLGASSAAARDELEQALPRLRELLAQNGLTLAGATVSGGREERPSQTLHRRDGYESQAAVNGVTAPESAALQRSTGTTGRIDLFA